MKKSNLDEMQEQKLLKIESQGYYIAFAGLLLLIMAQIVLFRSGTAVIGELVLLLVVSCFITFRCLREGIWSRKSSPNWRISLLGSMAAAVFIAVFSYFLLSSVTDDVTLITYLTAGLTILTLLLCLAAFAICGKIYKKKRAVLDEE